MQRGSRGERITVRTPSSARRTVRGLRGVRAIGLGLALVSAFAFTLPAPEALPDVGEGGLSQVAHFQSGMWLGRRHLEVDPGPRRLFEIGQPQGGSGMVVEVRDLDSLSVIRTIPLDDASTGYGGQLSAVDERRHRLYVTYPVMQAPERTVRQTLGQRDTLDAVRTFFAIAVIDTIHLRVLATKVISDVLPTSPQDASAGNKIGLKAIGYFNGGDGDEKLYLVSEIPVGSIDYSVSNHTVWVHQLDVEKVLDVTAASALDWSSPIPQCATTMAREAPSVVYRTGNAIFVPCRTGAMGNSPFAQPLSTPGVVRLTIVPGATRTDALGFSSDFFPISGNLKFGLVAIDPVAERLLLHVIGSATETNLWVFETASASWLGAVVLPSSFSGDGTVGLAVDTSLGRLYALSTQQAVVGDSRAGQAEQGRVASFRTQGVGLPNRQRAVVDPVRRRVFIGAASGYVVLEDRIPPTVAPEPVDPDTSTTDIEEGPDTAVTFAGATQAYGSRWRWVGGGRGVEQNVNVVYEDPPIPPEIRERIGPIAPSGGTRDMEFGRVFGATLTDGEATAGATPADRDAHNTDNDLGHWTSFVRDNGGPDLVDERWPFPSAHCADFGGPDDARESKGLGVEVACDRDRAEVRASSDFETITQILGGSLALKVGESKAATSSHRDDERGVVSVAEAEVRGVDFGGLAGIGRVASRAETWATGRPKASNGVGAGSAYAVTFEDVWVQQADGSRTTLCGGSCNPAVFGPALNRALGARFRVEFPTYDAVRAEGTPGGFEALLVRDPFDQVNERSVNDETDVRLEVPALIVTAFADGRVRSRVVAYLAGVAAESHYGIAGLPEGLSPEPGEPLLGAPASVDAGLLAPPPSSPELFDDSSGGGSPLRRFTRKVFAGMRFLFASPGQALRAGGFWALLAGPLLLWMRRRPLEALSHHSDA